MNATVLFDETPMMYKQDRESEVVTILKKGDKVAVIEKTSLLWWKVAHNEFTGYVKHKYLQGENDSLKDDIAISIPRDCALAILKALEFSLKS